MTYRRVGSLLRWLALVAANALFLWMFLSVAPIESMGDAVLEAGGSPETAGRIALFVADWRHGMTGNSPIYMPGFFALAAAAWYWTRTQSLPRLLVEGALALGAGCGVAWMTAPIGMTAASVAFAATFSFEAIATDARIWHAAVLGGYTAVCWTVFVVASRKALVTRSFRALAPVPLAYVVLVLTRPWAVDSLLATWGSRVIQGDLVAIGSLLAIPVLTTIFVTTARRLQADESGTM